jgi:phosphatidate cytidylyltransferase
MLKYRVPIGILLILSWLGLLWLDRRFAPEFPLWWIITFFAGLAACLELHQLLPAEVRPDRTSLIPAVLAVLSANWYDPVRETLGWSWLPLFADPWQPVWLTLMAVGMMAFFHEMFHRPEAPGRIVRIAYTHFALLYLGFFPSALIRLRWADVSQDVDYGLWLVALVVFVPKGADIAAYFMGRAIGRTPFAPKLSPKKTWEGFIAGLAGGALVALGLNQAAGLTLFRYGQVEALAFGVVMAGFGTLGDLAESMLKRDCLVKDASQAIPGFGGWLDVIDSVLLTAPPAYLWLSRH